MSLLIGQADVAMELRKTPKNTQPHSPVRFRTWQPRNNNHEPRNTLFSPCNLFSHPAHPARRPIFHSLHTHIYRSTTKSPSIPSNFVFTPTLVRTVLSGI